MGYRAVVESGEEGDKPMRKRIGVGNERADAGRDDRPCLARPFSLSRTGTGAGKIQWTPDYYSWIAKLPRFMPNLPIVMTAHARTHKTT